MSLDNFKQIFFVVPRFYLFRNTYGDFQFKRNFNFQIEQKTKSEFPIKSHWTNRSECIFFRIKFSIKTNQNNDFTLFSLLTICVFLSNRKLINFHLIIFQVLLPISILSNHLSTFIHRSILRVYILFFQFFVS